MLVYTALADGGVRKPLPGGGEFTQKMHAAAVAVVVVRSEAALESATKEGRRSKIDFSHNTNSPDLAKQDGVLLGAKGHRQKQRRSA